MLLVEVWTQFLSDLLLIPPTKGKRDLRLELDAELVAACTGCRNLAYKCVTTIEQILIYDWSSGKRDILMKNSILTDTSVFYLFLYVVGVYRVRLFRINRIYWIICRIKPDNRDIARFYCGKNFQN